MDDLTEEQRARALELYRLHYYLKYGHDSAITDAHDLLPGTATAWLDIEKHILQSHERKPVWRPTTRDEIQAGWEVRSRQRDGKEGRWGVAHHWDEVGDWLTESGRVLTWDAAGWTYETTAPEPDPEPDPRVDVVAQELHDGSACKVVWPCESTADCYRKRAVDLLARLNALTAQH